MFVTLIGLDRSWKTDPPQTILNCESLQSLHEIWVVDCQENHIRIVGTRCTCGEDNWWRGRKGRGPGVYILRDHPRTTLHCCCRNNRRKHVCGNVKTAQCYAYSLQWLLSERQCDTVVLRSYEKLTTCIRCEIRHLFVYTWWVRKKHNFHNSIAVGLSNTRATKPFHIHHRILHNVILHRVR